MDLLKRPMSQKFVSRSSLSNIMAFCFALSVASLLTACGGSNSATNPTPTPTPTPAANTVVQVNMGDAPADWMLAFSMNITSMSLMGSNGSATVISTSMPMEMMHLMGTMQPLAMVSAAQGNYTGASISIGSATVMYMDPITKSPIQMTISGPIAATMTFSTPIAVGSTPMVIGFDLDLAHSVTMDGSGKLSMSPVFHVSSGTQGSGNPLDPANGGIQHMMGAASSMSSSSFSMTSMQAVKTFAFATNSSTQFDNMSGVSMMTNGMLLMVDARLQPDGSLMATRVLSMMSSGGVMGGGVVTSVTGTPATQLTLVMQNGAGTGMMATAFAAGVTVDLTPSTVYQIDSDGVDMSSLPFAPVYDSTHIHAGQGVMPISASGMMGGGMGGGMMGGNPLAGTITSAQIDLEPQGLSGTVASAISSGSATSFVLTVPSDSAFSTLTGASSVTVYQQTGTTVSSTSPIASGTTVHAFGLLFLDAGKWRMVASRIGSN